MYRLLIIAIALTFVFAIGAQAQALNPPPAHGGYAGGWGFNPTNWDYQGGDFAFDGMYSLSGPLGGLGWVSIPGLVPITYAPISIELWIEMRSIQTYQYTSYQYHRIGLNAAEDITFLIQGTVRSNEDLWVSLTKADAVDGNKLKFVSTIGVGGTLNSSDIPITWTGQYGNGLVYGVSPVIGPTPLAWFGNDLFVTGNNVDQIPPTDHWFAFTGAFTIPYNQGDGYYALTLAGCPAPEM